MKHVLVVEDTLDLAELVMMTLGSMKLEAHHVNNGSKALAYLEAGSQPDLIILDINMPGMTGWQVLEAIKQRFPDLKTPVIVTTALSDPANKVVGKMQSAVVRYITKPYDITALKQAVTDALGLS